MFLAAFWTIRSLQPLAAQQANSCRLVARRLWTIYHWALSLHGRAHVKETAERSRRMSSLTKLQSSTSDCSDYKLTLTVRFTNQSISLSLGNNGTFHCLALECNLLHRFKAADNAGLRDRSY